MQNSRKPEDEQTANYCKNPCWLLGLVLSMVGAVTDLAALSFASQGVVAACGGATTLIVNNLFAKFWIGEALGGNVLYGVSFVVLGAMLLGISTPQPPTIGPPVNYRCDCGQFANGTAVGRNFTGDVEQLCCMPFPDGFYTYFESLWFLGYCLIMLVGTTWMLFNIGSSSLHKVFPPNIITAPSPPPSLLSPW